MTGTTVLKLTPAPRRALEVIARAPRRAARESNGTSDPTPLSAPTGGDPTIYWQSRAWLCDNGLIEPLSGQSNWYQLTAAGVELVDQLGLGVVDGSAAAKATSSTAAAGAAADGLGEAGIAVTLGAETFARRLGLDIWGKNAPRRFFGDKHWSEPLRWNRKAERAGTPQTVFCASMADVFEDRAELRPHRDRLWELIEATPSLRWLLLTKRPENMVAMAPWGANEWPAHVWPGTTTENLRWAAVRIPHLQGVDAAVRFLSVEPLLEDIADDLDLDGISWVIVGGESGPKARPTHPQWARKLRDRCRRQGVRYFFKQWGHWAPLGDSRPTAHPGTCVHVDGTTCGGADHDRSGSLEPTVMFPVGKKAAGRQLDGRTWDELPAELPLLGLVDHGGGHRRVGRSAPTAADNRNEGPGLLR